MMKTFAHAPARARAAQLGAGSTTTAACSARATRHCAATDSCVRPFGLAAGHVRLSPPLSLRARASPHPPSPSLLLPLPPARASLPPSRRFPPLARPHRAALPRRRRRAATPEAQLAADCASRDGGYYCHATSPPPCALPLSRLSRASRRQLSPPPPPPPPPPLPQVRHRRRARDGRPVRDELRERLRDLDARRPRARRPADCELADCPRCVSWYDGCNTCRVAGGSSAAAR